MEKKTPDGEPFWKMPKRPPREIEFFDPKNPLHCNFLAALAVQRAKLFKLVYPEDFRTDEGKLRIAEQSMKFKIKDFVPSR